jgi:micrococcal nuclease
VRHAPVTVVAPLVALAALAPAAPAGAQTVLTGTVSRVIDGDTVRVVSRGFETPVRLLGIDTPETRAPGTPVQCWGPRATAAMRRLAPPGARVRLVTDPGQDTRDRYGRLLAYVYRPGMRASVNLVMVRTGNARAYVYDRERPPRYADAYARAQAAARRARRGLWGPPCHGGTAAPARTPAAVAGPRCDPGYRGACVPPAPPDLDCDDVRARVRVVGDDPHRLDGNGDGWGCERYG